MSESIVVMFEKKSYTWDDGRWYGTVDYTKPTLGLIHKLNALLPAVPAPKAKRARGRRVVASEPPTE